MKLNMSLKIQTVCMVYVLCLYLHQADSLQCYDCGNQLDPKCGVTWGYGPGDTTKLVECNDTAMACRKLQTYDSYIGDIVTRECWQPYTDITEEYYMTCEELAETVSCYCNGTDGCNGQERITSFPVFAAVPLVLFVYKLFT